MPVSYKEFRSVKTWGDLYKFGNTQGYMRAQELLKKYIEEDEPSFFGKGLSDRETCKALSMGIESIPEEKKDSIQLKDLRYGMDLFDYLTGL